MKQANHKKTNTVRSIGKEASRAAKFTEQNTELQLPGPKRQRKKACLSVRTDLGGLRGENVPEARLWREYTQRYWTAYLKEVNGGRGAEMARWLRVLGAPAERLRVCFLEPMSRGSQSPVTSAPGPLLAS